MSKYLDYNGLSYFWTKVKAYVDAHSGGGSSVPTGTVSMFAGSSAPSGWLLCQGQAVSRTIYSALFSAIGTTYGAGNGSTTFNLPDLQGKFALGKSSSYALGSTGGAATVTLTTNQIPAHTHKASNYKALTGWQGDSPGFFLSDDVQGGSTATGPNTGSTGGGAAHENMPPYQTVNYIIKA